MKINRITCWVKIAPQQHIFHLVCIVSESVNIEGQGRLTPCPGEGIGVKSWQKCGMTLFLISRYDDDETLNPWATGLFFFSSSSFASLYSSYVYEINPYSPHYGHCWLGALALGYQ